MTNKELAYPHAIRDIKLDSSAIRGISKKCSNAEKRGEFSNVVSMSYGSCLSANLYPIDAIEKILRESGTNVNTGFITIRN